MADDTPTSKSKKTSKGRVTEEHLQELEAWSRRGSRWQMGVSAHVVKALVEEVREHRKEKEGNA